MMRRIAIAMIMAGVLGVVACGGDGVVPTATFKLIRLDGTKLDLTAKPIPLRVAVEATFSVPMDQASVEAAMTVTDDAGAAVPGTFSWNADSTVATCTLSKNLKLQKTYHVKIAATASSKGTMEAVDQPFTTMTRGDVNGDGYTDLVVGAEGTDVAGGTRDGTVYVFSGATIAGTHGVGDALATINGTEPEADFGDEVSASGDVNGDGYADVLVGALFAAAGGTKRGAAYLFSGATLTGTKTQLDAMASFAGDEDNDYFASRVSILDDINNDGYDEAGITATDADAFKGAAYIFQGGPTLAGAMPLSAAFATIQGENVKDYLGNALASAGDIDADGTPDVIVGVTCYPGLVDFKGAAFIFSGATLSGTITANTTTAYSTIIGAAGERFGVRVAGQGDINGDGRDDVVISALYNANYRGEVFFFDGATIAGVKSSADNFSTVIGNADKDDMYQVSGIGDFNGDGRADILIGANGVAADANDGAAYVFSGADLAGPKTVADAFATIAAAAGSVAQLGNSVSGGGDVNGDGVPDFAVGAGGTDSSRGAAYVFSGAALTAGTTLDDAFATLFGNASHDYLGGSVSL